MTSHYVYKIEFETGHYYFGVRSCECLPEEDSYLGSPVTHKHYWDEQTPSKTILRTFKSRTEANEWEAMLIEWGWSVNKALSLNASIRGSKFCMYGVKMPEVSRKKMSQAKKNVVTTTQEYYLISPKGKIYKGDNIAQFCREKKLDLSQTCKLLRSEVFHNKGWTNSLENHKKYLEKYEIRGLTKTKNGWILKITHLKETLHLNFYKDLQLAKQARNLAEVIWGKKYKVYARGIK